MLGIWSEDAPTSKFYVSHGALPQYIDPKQPPGKKKPFATIANQPFNHTVDRYAISGTVENLLKHCPRLNVFYQQSCMICCGKMLKRKLKPLSTRK